MVAGRGAGWTVLVPTLGQALEVGGKVSETLVEEVDFLLKSSLGDGWCVIGWRRIGLGLEDLAHGVPGEVGNGRNVVSTASLDEASVLLVGNANRDDL